MSSRGQQVKKALLVTTVSGFVPQFEMNNVRLLQEMGYEVHYASNFGVPMYRIDEEELKARGMILHDIPLQKEPGRVRQNTVAVGMLRRLMQEEGFSIVHCHNPMGSVAARIAAARVNPRPFVIYTTHGLHYFKGAPAVNRVFDLAERLLAHKTDLIITINQEDCERAAGYRLRKGGKAALIPGVGVDLDRFCPRPELRRQVREELNVPDNAFHLVTAAELNDNKNHRVVIEAIARMGRKDLIYSLCGSDAVSRSTSAQLKKLIRENGLEQQVRFLGLRSDMERVLQSADVFAFPSKREGLGLAAIEALACGIPVIASDNRGSREYLKDGVNGIRCRAESAEDFQRAIERFMDDKAFRLACADAARASIARFDRRETEKIMRALYEEADAAAGRAFRPDRK